MIRTEQLTKRYGAHAAVEKLDLDVSQGDFFGLLGPNGAGKTTSIRMLSGLLAPTSGRVSVNGLDPQHSPNEVRRSIGVVSESHGYYGWMSGEQYLSYFADLYGIRQKAQRVRHLLGVVGLENAGSKAIRAYSRGMRQRLGIARAIVHQPQVLLLDEPTLGLDPGGQREIYAVLRDLNQKGTTVFLSSHSLAEIEPLVKRVAVLNAGRLVAQGTIDEISRTLDLAPRIRLTVSEPARALGIARCEPEAAQAALDGGQLVLTAPAAGALDDATIVRRLVIEGIRIRELVTLEPSLEDIFFRLTARERKALE